MRALYLALMTLVFSLGAVASPPWEGLAAPEFRLQDQDGAWHALKDYQGQWLVLYFYPKDKTPGCSTEAENFRNRMAEYDKLKARVVGISLDDVASHKDFAETLKLPFTLLSDSDKRAAKAYDVLTELGPLTYTARQTFIIGPDGTILKHYPKVDPKTHADTVLAALAALQKP